MNLSVKSFGQLAVSAIALFFFSCSEETSPLGFKNPDPKFQNRFVEIPLTSSVILLDSVRTSNADAVNDLNRLIVGKHNDPLFGEVMASAFTQVYPVSNLIDLSSESKPADDKENDSLEFQSIELRLLVDYYAYGAQSKTTQTFKVHRLTEKIPASYSVTTSSTAGGQQKPVDLVTNYKKTYFNKSVATAEATAIGTGSIEVDYDKFATELSDDTFDSLVVTTPLDNAFGQEIFDLMNTEAFRDSILLKPSKFMDLFKGIVITPENSDKVIRFYLPGSSIRITYKDTGVTGKVHTLDIALGTSSIFGLVSFNEIKSNRGSTALDGLNNFFEPFEPVDGRRYIQAGTGIVTKIDFSKFLEFADTIDQMLINSAEFVITEVETPGSYTPPSNLAVKLINSNNRFKKISYPGRGSMYSKDVEDINLYQGFVNFDRNNYFTTAQGIPFDSTMNIVNDVGSFLTLNYSSDEKSYRGTAGLFFQKLFEKDEAKTPFTQAILLPYSPSRSSSIAYGVHIAGKSLNRTAFDQEKIVLRIYYTVPTVE
jgi:hypothetical protein